MNAQCTRTPGDRGVALIIAMLVLLVLSTLGASLMLLTQTQVRTSYSLKRLTQARYAAEGGVQNAIRWLAFDYTVDPATFTSFNMTGSPVTFNGTPVVLSAMSGVDANYPDSAIQAAFNGALRDQSIPGADVGMTYAVSATLQSMRLIVPFGSDVQRPLQTWVVRSVGTINGGQAQVEVTATIERFGRSVFSFAAFSASPGCNAMTLGGGARTDSYDSSAGTYGATVQTSGGDIGANGNLGLSGVTTIVQGSAATPNPTTGTCGAGAVTGLSLTSGASSGSITGGMRTLPNAISYVAPDPPDPLPPTTPQALAGNCGAVSGCVALPSPPVRHLSLAPGDYGSLAISANTSVHLSAGVYTVNSLSVSAVSSLVIDSGPVVIHVAGQGGAGDVVAFSSGSTVVNPSGRPRDLQILYGGSRTVTLSGGPASHAVVYAPNAPMVLSGSADWYGSLVAYTLAVDAGRIHYDRSLEQSFLGVGGYQLTSFSLSRF